MTNIQRVFSALGILLILGLLVLPGALGDTEPAERSHAPDDLLVVVMDVGQGDGIFIRTPGGKNILIDAGQDARRGVLPFLRAQNITRIDALVASHPHADHMGGAAAVMRYADVRQVLDSGKNHATPQYEEFLSTIRELEIPYRNPRAGEKLNWDPALDVMVLHPDNADYDNVNDNSIVIRVAYKGVSFLFTGDAEEEAEDVILGSFRGRLKSDVLKVPHHGSRTSSTPEFLDAVQPKYAVISCGHQNSFRHPRPETLRNLEQVDAKIIRTDIEGYVMFKTDGKKIRTYQSPVPFPKIDLPAGNPRPFDGPEWSGKAAAREEEAVLEAGPGENLWSHIANAPRWMMPAPPGAWSCGVSVNTQLSRKTESGLILWSDEKNFVIFGRQEERLTALTVVKNGRVSLGPEQLVFTPGRIAFRKTARFLEALAYDAPEKTWRVLWRLSKKDMPRIARDARIGVYAKSWGNGEAAATFTDFRIAAALP